MSAPAGLDPERYAPKLAPAGAALAVLGGCAGGWAGLLLAGVGLLLLAAACVSRDQGLLLLGPFVRAELVRAARGRRLRLWRCVYAAAALGLAGLCFLPALEQPGGVPAGRDLPRYAETFFLAFAVVQFLYLTYLTAALVAPIVAEEREARRWDLLLATDLRAREILLGKAAGRLPQLLDPVLASLPVLAVMPLFGGVSPRLVVVAAVGTLAMMLGTAGIAFFYSVFAPTARIAAGRTLFLVLFYQFGSGLVAFAAYASPWWTFPSTPGWTSPVELRDGVEVVSAGNPISTTAIAAAEARTGLGEFESLLGSAARRFAAFQLGVALLFGLTAIARLRAAVPWAARAPAPPPEEKQAPRPPRAERPPVGEMPVYWWERYGWPARDRGAVVIPATPGQLAAGWLGLVVVFLGMRAADAVWPSWNLVQITRGLFGAVFCFGAIGVLGGTTFKAAAAVARERAADTLDGLRLTALTPRDILYEKWLGCVASEAGLFATVVVAATAAAVTGLSHPLTVIGLLVTVPVYAAAGAAVGLYFSVAAPTPAQASLKMALYGCGGMVALAWGASLLVPSLPGAGLAAAVPGAAVGVICFAGEVLRETGGEEQALLAGGVAAGPVIAAAVGLAAWRAAVRRFERQRAA